MKFHCSSLVQNTRLAMLAFLFTSGLSPCTAAVDIQPPTVGSISITPTTVDATSGAKLIQIGLAVTDDSAGVRSVTVNLYEPDGRLWEFVRYMSPGSGRLVRTSGDGLSGSYAGTLAVPQSGQAGAWRVEVVVDDICENSRTYGGNGGEAFPGGSSGLVTVQNSGFQDLAAPAITAVSLIPPTIDISDGMQIVSVEIAASDDASGVGAIALSLTAPGGSSVTRTSFPPSGSSSLFLVSGDGRSGIYRGELVVPRYAAAGTWTLSASIRDRTGRVAAYGGAGGEAFPVGATTMVTVENSAQVDSEPPVLTAFALAPATADVTSASAPVSFSLTVTDDVAGLDLAVGTPEIRVEFYDGDLRLVATATLSGEDGMAPISQTGGTPLDGTYSGNFSIPRSSVAGSYSTFVFLTDSSGKTTGYPFDRPFPAGVQNRVAVTNNGPVDVTPPALVSYTLSPGSADVTGSARNVVVEAQVTDDVSGVADLTIELELGGASTGELVYRSGGSPAANTLTRISGTATGGVYRGTFTLPADTPPGGWSSAFLAVDGNGRTRLHRTNFQFAPFPEGIESSLDVENRGQADAGPPRLAVPFPSTTASAAGASARPVTVDLSVSDDSSGVAGITLNLVDPAGKVVQSIGYGDGGAGTLGRVSGTTTSGAYRGSVTIPPDAAPGKWRLEASATDAFGRTGYSRPSTITVGAQVPVTLASWAGTYSLSGDAALPAADGDADGVELLLEYAFNLNPTTKGSPVLPAVTGTVGLPRTSVTGQGDDRRLRVEYLRRRNATDLGYIPEFSSSLQPGGDGGWSLAFNTPVIVPIDADWERIVVEDSVPLSASNPRFARVRVVFGSTTEGVLTLATWAAGFSLSGAAALDEADDDGDGIVLLLEYAFNLDPTVSATPPLLSGGSSGLPAAAVASSAEGSFLRLEFIRRSNTSDLTYIPEFSSSLKVGGAGGWEAATRTPVVIPVGTTLERVIVEDAVPVSAGGSRYGRVRVVRTP